MPQQKASLRLSAAGVNSTILFDHLNMRVMTGLKLHMRKRDSARVLLAHSMLSFWYHQLNLLLSAYRQSPSN